ncbi:hypothetical protein QBC45DRAFT_290160, partial [Copromyces sp. CBS 386.78]
MSSPPESSHAEPEDDLDISSSAPLASQARHHVRKRAIYMYIKPRSAYEYATDFDCDPPFDPQMVAQTAKFGCYPKHELKDPDAMHWYTFANRSQIWNICKNPVPKHEQMKASPRGSVAMPFGPANSAALTSDYQGPLIPRYATAVTELPQDPTDDPHAFVKRWPVYLERLEAWKDEVAQTAEHNVDPDEIFPSPPSTYLASPP